MASHNKKKTNGKREEIRDEIKETVEKAKDKITYRNMTIKQRVIIGIVLVFFLSWAATNGLFLSGTYKLIGEAIIQNSRSITVMGEAMREYQSDNWHRGMYQRDYLSEDIEGKFLFAVPIIGAIKVMEKKADELGYRFRVPKFQPRNPKNTPDEVEAKILTMMKDQNIDEYFYHTEDGDDIRYFKAIRLTEDCLICHGNPARSEELWGNAEGLDPTGAKMENWKTNEIHGAFEVIYSKKQLRDLLHNMIIQNFIVNIIIVALAMVLIRLVVKRSLAPLDTISRSLEEINEGAGDLTKKVPILRDDEVGHMAELFNSFLDQLKDMVFQIRDASDHVAASSDEMTGSSENLANVAQDQAASIEQTSSGMEEIKATIDSVSENAKEQARKTDANREAMEYLASQIGTINSNAQNASGMAEDTHNYAKEGEQILGQTVESMNEINNSSKKITEIVTIITDISDQINLLSLNASIEAARAGEHGKGFAVVAEEISKLAEQTAQSSGEINKLILETNNKVTSGSELVKRTADSLVKIIDNVKNTAALMEDIAHSSIELNERSDKVSSNVATVNQMSEEISVMMEEQSISTNEIINAINQINDVTQSVASGSEELAAASEELSSQSEVLKEIVDRFKVTE